MIPVREELLPLERNRRTLDHTHMALQHLHPQRHLMRLLHRELKNVMQREIDRLRPEPQLRLSLAVLTPISPQSDTRGPLGHPALCPAVSRSWISSPGTLPRTGSRGYYYISWLMSGRQPRTPSRCPGIRQGVNTYGHVGHTSTQSAACLYPLSLMIPRSSIRANTRFDSRSSFSLGRYGAGGATRAGLLEPLDAEGRPGERGGGRAGWRRASAAARAAARASSRLGGMVVGERDSDGEGRLSDGGRSLIT